MTQNAEEVRVACAACGREIWYWSAYWRIGRPDVSYCSRECAAHSDGDVCE